MHRYRDAILLLIPVIGIAFLMDAPRYLGMLLWWEQYYAAFLALILAAVFVTYPMSSNPRSPLRFLDLALSLIGLSLGAYLAVNFPELSIAEPSLKIAALGGATILLLFEATRRTTGWTLIIISAAFVAYALFAHLMPGVLAGRGIPATRLGTYLFVDATAVIGAPIQIASTVVLAFIVFGAFLTAVGGAAFLSDFASALTGRFVGGPAKVSVVSSAFMGTISGSAVSNVMITGPLTIPMMRRVGYSPTFAGAVEAVASTGGLILPPVMGAAAFIMVDFVGLPYRQIAIAALIPALLYFCGIFFQVDLEARKHKMPRGAGPSARELSSLVIRDGWTFLVPSAVLLYLLFGAYMRAEMAGLQAGIVALVLGVLSRRITWPALLEQMLSAGRALAMLGIICAVAGIVVGTANVSGLGLRISQIILAVGGTNEFLLVIAVAVASIILGMGLPATVVYVLLASLIAPAFVKLGFDALGAHLFIFYFGMLSMITPPICLAAYAAASIAGGSPMKTGFQASRLGIVAFIIPFVFLYSPELLMHGEPLAIAVAAISALVGTFFVSAALTGYLFGPTGPAMRGLMLAVGLLLFVPDSDLLPKWLTAGSGLLAGLASLLVQVRSSKAASRLPVLS